MEKKPEPVLLSGDKQTASSNVFEVKDTNPFGANVPVLAGGLFGSSNPPTPVPALDAGLFGNTAPAA